MASTFLNLAKCINKLNAKAPCPTENPRDFLCNILCCCTRFPFASPSGKTDRYDACATIMLNAQHAEQYGIYANIPFNMKAPGGPQSAMNIVSAAKLSVFRRALESFYRIRSANNVYNKFDMRIPDVVIAEPGITGKISSKENKGVCDFKFNKDTWGDGQREAYTEIGGGKEPDKLTSKNCYCNDGKLDEELATTEADEKLASEIDKYAYVMASDALEALPELGQYDALSEIMKGRFSNIFADTTPEQEAILNELPGFSEVEASRYLGTVAHSDLLNIIKENPKPLLEEINKNIEAANDLPGPVQEILKNIMSGQVMRASDILNGNVLLKPGQVRIPGTRVAPIGTK